MVNNAWTASAALLLSAVTAQQFVMYTPVTDDTAVERMDAILNPGAISQHVHQIFGASGMNPSQSYQSLQSSKCTTVADSSNHGNADDNSVYWHPALFMEASNGTGYIRVPTGGHKLYYKNAGSPDDKLADPFEFPEGFRMIAGNTFLRAAPEDVQQQNITQWICHSSSGMNQGTAGGFPNGVTDCDAVDGFNGAIHFPHCWNGNDFDPANPTAHVTYPTGDIQEGVCPSSHPTRLPHLFIENTFNIHAVVDQVKPDTFVLAMGDTTGYGWHFDFYNGWNPGSIPALLHQCPQGEYGNEDIGTCPNFNASSVPADECKLTVTFVEEVTDPGEYLPGCNPIVNTNPAPDYLPAPLGVHTDVCSTAPSGNSRSTSAAASSSTATSAPASTFATMTSAPAVPTTSSTAAPAVTSGSHPHHKPGQSSGDVQPYSPSAKIDCPAANNTLHAASNGQVYRIECGIDHFEGDMAWKEGVSGLAECIETCAATKGCVDVSLSGVACYMKSSVGNNVYNDVWGARLVSSSSKATRTHPRAF